MATACTQRRQTQHGKPRGVVGYDQSGAVIDDDCVHLFKSGFNFQLRCVTTRTLFYRYWTIEMYLSRLLAFWGRLYAAARRRIAQRMTYDKLGEGFLAQRAAEKIALYLIAAELLQLHHGLGQTGGAGRIHDPQRMTERQPFVLRAAPRRYLQSLRILFARRGCPVYFHQVSGRTPGRHAGGIRQRVREECFTHACNNGLRASRSVGRQPPDCVAHAVHEGKDTAVGNRPDLWHWLRGFPCSPAALQPCSLPAWWAVKPSSRPATTQSYRLQQSSGPAMPSMARHRMSPGR